MTREQINCAQLGPRTGCGKSWIARHEVFVLRCEAEVLNFIAFHASERLKWQMENCCLFRSRALISQRLILSEMRFQLPRGYCRKEGLNPSPSLLDTGFSA